MSIVDYMICIIKTKIFLGNNLASLITIICKWMKNSIKHPIYYAITVERISKITFSLPMLHCQYKVVSTTMSVISPMLQNAGSLIQFLVLDWPMCDVYSITYMYIQTTGQIETTAFMHVCLAEAITMVFVS